MMKNNDDFMQFVLKQCQNNKMTAQLEQLTNLCIKEKKIEKSRDLFINISDILI
jgi:hypothetical protein